MMVELVERLFAGDAAAVGQPDGDAHRGERMIALLVWSGVGRRRARRIVGAHPGIDIDLLSAARALARGEDGGDVDAGVLAELLTTPTGELLELAAWLRGQPG